MCLAVTSRLRSGTEKINTNAEVLYWMQRSWHLLESVKAVWYIEPGIESGVCSSLVECKIHCVSFGTYLVNRIIERHKRHLSTTEGSKQQTLRYTSGNRPACISQTWSDSAHEAVAKNPKIATTRKTSWPLRPGCRNDFPRARRTITHMMRQDEYPNRLQYAMKIGWG